jgi:hypothetical protein
LPDTVEKLLFGGGRATFSHSLKNNALIISKGYCRSPFRKVANYGLKNRVHRVFQQYRPVADPGILIAQDNAPPSVYHRSPDRQQFISERGYGLLR